MAGLVVICIRIILAHHYVLAELKVLDEQVDKLLALVYRQDIQFTIMNLREMQKLQQKFRESHEEATTNAGGSERNGRKPVRSPAR